MSVKFQSLTPSEVQLIEANRILCRQAFSDRCKRLRQILKPMSKRERRQWKAKYLCGMRAFMDPKL